MTKYVSEMEVPEVAKKKKSIPNYGRVTHNGIEYYRTRVTDADGKRVAIYGETPEELL